MKFIEMKQSDILGIIFLFLGITPLLSFLLFSRAEYVFWFSNHAFLILGIAMLFQSRFWIFAELCLGFVPELLWSIDYLFRLISGKFLWGFTNYMFTDAGAFNWFHLYSLQHLLFVPASIYALYILGGPVKKAWAGSFLHMAVLWIISWILPAELNVNCVREYCAWNVPCYPLVWPVAVVVWILVTYFAFCPLWSVIGKKAR